MLCAIGEASAQETVVRYQLPPPPYGLIYDYYGKVLDLALAKTAAQYGPYTLMPLVMQASNPRLSSMLEGGQDINVLIAQPSRERDERLIPIRIPLDKGLLGYRVMIVRAQDAKRFASVKTIEELKHFRMGQGFDWEDTHVLTAAGFQVELASDRSALLDMLSRGRFQAFPRGIYEVEVELQHYGAVGKGDLIAEPSLMVHYKATKIVYVNKKDPVLAERLEKGLRMALADGSFDALFNADPVISKTLQQVNFAGRRIFELPNSRIPADFPVNDPALWYVPPVSGRH